MVKRRVRRQSPAKEKVVAKRSQVEEEELDELEEELDELDEELDEEDFDEDDDVDEEDDDDEDEDDEDEEDEPAPRRVSRRVVRRKVADEEEPEPVKAKAKAKAKAAPADKAEKVEKTVAPVEIKSVDTMVAENLFGQLLASLEDGKSVIITALGKNKYQLSTGDAVKLASGKKMSNADYWAEVLNPAAVEWGEEWNQKTFEQKKAAAKKAGAKWEAHDDPRIEAMRITQAMREKLGIEKYKPEYRDRSARAALRGG